MREMKEFATVSTSLILLIIEGIFRNILEDDNIKQRMKPFTSFKQYVTLIFGLPGRTDDKFISK
jgi:hypothetical protein